LANQYGGSGSDAGCSMVQTPDHEFLIAGSLNSHDSDITKNIGDLDWVVCKTDSDGTLQWTKTYGGTGKDEATFIGPASDGNWLVAGYTNSHDGNLAGNHGLSVVLDTIDATGKVISQRLCGGSADDLPSRILESSPGYYSVTEVTASVDADIIGGHGSQDAWLFRF
jgi:hypothetical protein